MTSTQANSEIQSKAAKLVISGIGILIGFMLVFWSLGLVERSETPPLFKLALNQSGCASVNKSGIVAEAQGGICTITVRYRQNNTKAGGTIEKDGAVLMGISRTQIVSLSQLDDGSDEPWSVEHKEAIGFEIGAWLFILLSFALIGMQGDRNKQSIAK